MEPILILLALAAGAWLLLGPILLIVLWIRLRKVEDDVRRLRRTQLAKAEGAAPAVAAAVTAPVVLKPPRPRQEPEPAKEVLWIDEAAETAPPGTPAVVSASPDDSAGTPRPAEMLAASKPSPEKEAFSLEELLAG